MAKKLGRDEEDEGRPICRRCKTILTTPEETSRKFPDPTKAFAELRTAPSAVVICVADVLDLPGSLVTDLKKLTGDKPSILVVGKIDAMPEGWDRSAVRDYVDELASSLGIDEAVLVSAATSEGIKDLSVAVNELLSAARKRGENPSIYLVGRSNVGKSRLLNALIDFAVRRRNGGPFDALVTDSPLPGTTINSIRAPLTNFGTLFDTPDPPPAGNPPAEFVDTPGLPNPGNLLNLLTLPECRAVHPRSSLPSRAYVVDSGRSLFVSGLARIDCLEGMAEAAVFVSKGVDTHRTPTEKAGNFYERHVGTMLTPPVVTEENREERLKLLPPLKKALEVELTGSRHDSTDLVLSGLGWVNLRSRKGAKLEVWTSGGAGAATRRGWDAEVKEVVLPSGRRKSKD